MRGAGDIQYEIKKWTAAVLALRNDLRERARLLKEYEDLKKHVGFMDALKLERLAMILKQKGARRTTRRKLLKKRKTRKQ